MFPKNQPMLIAALLLSAACAGQDQIPTGPGNASLSNEQLRANFFTSWNRTHSTGGTSTTSTTTTTTTTGTTATSAAECSAMKAGWLFCDDFETDRMSKYFEYTNPTSFKRTASVGVGGSMGMQAKFAAGQSDAGSLKLAFGKTPDPYLRPVDGGTKIYREIYWRMYVKNDSTWTGGGGDKLSRAQSLANSKWAQAMVAPVWSGNPTSTAKNYLVMDPATGVSGSTLMETSYNDFAHQTYLGLRQGSVPIFDAAHVGKW